MQAEDRKPLAYGALGFACFVVGIVAPMKFPSMPPNIIDLLFDGGLAVMLSAAIWLLFEHVGRRTQRMLAIIGLVFCVSGSLIFAKIVFWSAGSDPLIVKHRIDETPASLVGDTVAAARGKLLAEDMNLIERSRNFAKSLRNFQIACDVEEEKWRKMEWSAYTSAETSAEKDKIWDANAERREGRSRQFVNRFLQNYNETALVLFAELSGKLQSRAIVPNMKSFDTALPPGFNTFKVTLDGIARNKLLPLNFGTRAADYYDSMADALSLNDRLEP